jgi:hypothetical protein
VKGEAMEGHCERIQSRRRKPAPARRHFEERSDEEIQPRPAALGLLRFARNDGGGLPPSAPALAP